MDLADWRTRINDLDNQILDLLNQREAVHSPQRAVYNGMITAKHTGARWKSSARSPKP